MRDSHGTLTTQSRWAQSKLLALLEIVLVAIVFFADWKHHIYFSKTPYLLGLAWLSLHVRGMHWRDVGVGIYRSWGRTLVIGILAGLGIELLELFCTQPLLAQLFAAMPDLSAFDRVAGNWKWLTVSLALTWTLFAPGEELFFRGYLLQRIAGLITHTRSGMVTSLLLVSFIFGLSHFGQGITGVTENFIDGILLGALYLKFGSKLAVPIVAHGVTDTVDFLLIFLHLYPGMH
jgi:membrane protease YdiL (CAAX protease family)